MSTHAPLGASLILLLTLGISVPSLAAGTAADPMPADRIEQLVAPIALYPDALIAQILMASTYPLDVVKAKRWLEDHEGLKGEALEAAVKDEPWDESVKALAFFPSVLTFMSDNLDWTQDLGDAVLAQEGDVTDTIQRLRRQADKAGALASNQQQRVEKAGDTIVIQPAQPETVYVPVYDPAKVYGQSPAPARTYYPDAYADASASYATTLPTSTVVPSSTVVYPATTETTSSADYSGLIGFGAGALVGGLLTAAIMWNDHDNDRIYYGGPGYWGGGSYWSQPAYWNNNGWRNPSNLVVNRNVDIDRTVNRGDITVNKGIVGNDVRKWEHNPDRRGGVRYRDDATRSRFTERRPEAGVGADEARGRLRGAESQPKAPDLGQIRAEGAASGKLTQLGQGRGEGKSGQIRDRQGTGQAPVASLQDRKAQGQGRPQAAVPKARPKADPAKANRRPLEKPAQRPAMAERQGAGAGAIKRPARPEAGAPRIQRAEGRDGPIGGGAFKSERPKMDRAASNRGAASRAAAGRAQAGGGPRGGGVRAGGGGGGGRGRR